MASPTTVSELQDLLAAGVAGGLPLTLLDVRRGPVYAAARDLIEGASWRDPEAVAEWADSLPQGRPVVVYCVHGHGVSQGVAARLEEAGLDARYLEGGIARWESEGGRLQEKG